MINSTQAIADIVYYLEDQDEAYFAERGRTKEDVLADEDLIDRLAKEHYKCVTQFGCDRDWSAMDACNCEPGIWKEGVE